MALNIKKSSFRAAFDSIRKPGLNLLTTSFLAASMMVAPASADSILGIWETQDYKNPAKKGYVSVNVCRDENPTQEDICIQIKCMSDKEEFCNEPIGRMSPEPDKPGVYKGYMQDPRAKGIFGWLKNAFAKAVDAFLYQDQNNPNMATLDAQIKVLTWKKVDPGKFAHIPDVTIKR